MTIQEFWEKFPYTFITEDGVTHMRYDEYLECPELMNMIGNPERQHLFLGRTILTFDPIFLAQNKAKQDAYIELLIEKERNPLQFFMPSGPGALAFLNDDDNKVCFLIAGNRSGKTATTLVKLHLKGIPCDPNWPIFKDHGVKYREFKKPQRFGIGSYEWGNHKKTVVPELLKWMSIAEAGPYHPKWTGKGARQVSWKDNPILPCVCGTEYHLFAYNQGQGPYESVALDGWDWDEQPPEPKWDGANERIRSNRQAQHNHSLTPHRLEGRPDTGAGTFLHGLWMGEDCKGYDGAVGRYRINLEEDVPDWVYPELSKKEAVDQWITQPRARGDLLTLREGLARIRGIWHETSGAVYPMWDSTVHMIDPFDVPRGATRFRYVDHGRRNPCAALYGFMHEKWPGILIIYREYYEKNRTIRENARGIVEHSGNMLVDDGVHRESSGATYNRLREVPSREKFLRTKMDSRSFSSPTQDTNLTIGDLYRIHGLNCDKCPGTLPENSVDVVGDWLQVDPTQPHPFYPGQKGLSKIYVFSTCKNFKYEITHYVNEEHVTKMGEKINVKEKPRDKDNHLMDCLRWMVIDTPRRQVERKLDRGEYRLDKSGQPVVKRRQDAITGY